MTSCVNEILIRLSKNPQSPELKSLLMKVAISALSEFGPIRSLLQKSTGDAKVKKLFLKCTLAIKYNLYYSLNRFHSVLVDSEDHLLAFDF